MKVKEMYKKYNRVVWKSWFLNNSLLKIPEFAAMAANSEGRGERTGRFGQV
jgi:hypothetical protein